MLLYTVIYNLVSPYFLREIYFILTVTCGLLLIRGLNLRPDYSKADLWQWLLIKVLSKENWIEINHSSDTDMVVCDAGLGVEESYVRIEKHSKRQITKFS